jgi:undecaprenyl-diphosphatase
MEHHGHPLSSLDRHAGAALRALTSRVPGGPAGARLAAGVMSPAFRLIVASLIVRPGRRRAGLEALAAGVLAAMSARALRDCLGRPRPGSRQDGGLPSRHAAAAVAIARAVGRHQPRAGDALALAATIGLLGRVAARHHDPADIAAGALLGAGADRAVARLAGRLARRGGMP